MRHEYYQNIQGWFDYHHFWDMMVDRFEKATFCEIGVWQGKSIMYLAEKIDQLGKDINIIAVDNFEGSSDNMLKESGMTTDELYGQYLKNIEPLKQYITTIRGNSKRVHKEILDKSLDLVFIDGDHSYEGCKRDIELWMPKVRDGGIIAGHDYTNLYEYGVIKAVGEFFKKKEINIVKPFVWWTIKK